MHSFNSQHCTQENVQLREVADGEISRLESTVRQLKSRLEASRVVRPPLYGNVYSTLIQNRASEQRRDALDVAQERSSLPRVSRRTIDSQVSATCRYSPLRSVQLAIAAILAATAFVHPAPRPRLITSPLIFALHATRSFSSSRRRTSSWRNCLRFWTSS